MIFASKACACVEQDKVTKERGYSGIANTVSGSCMSHRRISGSCMSHRRISGSWSHRRISGSCTLRATVGYQGIVCHTVGYQGVVRYAPP